MAAALPPPAMGAPPPAPAPAGYRVIPFAITNVGHLLVRGEVNGRPVDILIDTGSTYTVIDRNWATGIGIMLQPIRDRAYGAGGANLVLARAADTTLSIGGLALTDITLYALDLTAIVATMRISGAVTPRVILGGNLLRQHRAIIDYATSRLWLAPAR